MKGLILSVTAGQGHNQTAKVLCDCFAENGVECSYLDTFEYVSPLIAKTVSDGYLMATKTLPKTYGMCYRSAEKPTNAEMHFTPKVMNALLSKKLIDMIAEEAPDFLICTHVYAALLITQLKEYVKKDIKMIGIITDFTVHPYWEDTKLDVYVTASELLTNQGVKKGIPKEKFLPIGIPIDRKFETKTDKAEARKKLNIDDKRTILVMSGSMGYGKIVDEIIALDKLDLDFQMITVCGNNKKLKEKIDVLKTRKKLYNYGYVNNVDVMMDAADCIVTKPGGLTTSEALAKELPMIMNNPVPGQEDRNVEFLLNCGAAIKASDTYPMDDAVIQMFSGDRMEKIRETVKQIGKPYATRDLIEYVINK